MAKFDLKNFTESLLTDNISLRQYAKAFNVSKRTLKNAAQKAGIDFDEQDKKWKRVVDSYNTENPAIINIHSINFELQNLKTRIENLEKTQKEIPVDLTDLAFPNLNELRQKYNYRKDSDSATMFCSRVPMDVITSVQRIFRNEQLTTTEGMYLVLQHFVNNYDNDKETL